MLKPLSVQKCTRWVRCAHLQNDKDGQRRRPRLWLARTGSTGRVQSHRQGQESTALNRTVGSKGHSSPVQCRRLCVAYETRKVNLSTVFAGQKVGVVQVSEHIWLVSFMDYDLGYFDDETCRLEPIDNPFGSKVLPMPSE